MNGHEMIGAPRVEREAALTPQIDPLRYCVMTTVALLAWALGPAMVVAMSAIGFVAYWRATRSGLTRTRCVLRYPMLVMGYLALAFLAAIAAMVL
jgi:hypothetical protein